jgi:hypothetical protein
MVQLPVVVPPFFLEACGYRGAARYVALRWVEETGELWLSDDGHAVRGRAHPLAFLWRRDGGAAALERLRTERAELGRPPWLLVDRTQRTLFMGKAVSVWRVVMSQEVADPKIIRSG